MDDAFYVLDCHLEGWSEVGTAEFFCNGIPIARLGHVLPAQFSDHVNEYLIGFRNELSMLIRPVSSDLLDLLPRSAGASARLALTRYPFGAISGGPDGELLVSTVWKLPEVEKRSQLAAMFPQHRSAAIDLGPMPGRPWAWERAEPVRLDDPEREEILEVLRTMHAALLVGDAGPFVEAGALRLQDLEEAYPSFSADERRELIVEMTKKQSREAWWGLAPLDLDRFDLRACSDDRLVECRATDGKPLLRERPDPKGNVAYYEMFLAKIEGRWQIVR